MQYSDPVVIQTRSQSLSLKHNNFLKLRRSYLVRNEEKRKQEKKLPESLHLTLKIARRSNDMTLVSETSHKQNHCGNHKASLNEKPTNSSQ